MGKVATYITPTAWGVPTALDWGAESEVGKVGKVAT